MAATLRPARAGDIPAIAAIYRDEVLTGTATYELVPPDACEMAARMRALQDDGYPYVVAVDAGGVVQGYAYAGAFRTRPAYNWIVENSIYLAPGARGQGTGTRLLDRLIADCEVLGFRQMLAVIGGTGNRGSIRLHERAGFAMVGTLAASGLKFGRWIDTVLMQRPLGDGAHSLPDVSAYPGGLRR